MDVGAGQGLLDAPSNQGLAKQWPDVFASDTFGAATRTNHTSDVHRVFIFKSDDVRKACGRTKQRVAEDSWAANATFNTATESSKEEAAAI